MTAPTSSLMSWPRTCSVCATGSASSGGVFDLTGLRARLEELNAEISRPDLWDDREKAKKTSREKTSLERELSLFDELESSLDDAATLLELAEEADDNEARGEAAEHFRGVEDVLEAAEMRQLLGGEHDRGDVILSINSGAGGTDACDWADTLMRMYLRWVERQGFTVEIIDLQAGEEAGIRSATLSIRGDYAYGYLNVEQGVHRLVRISPFDSQARRHT
ncbi:MAG: PCRF domain-containing protein, partial [Myxococcota bacterium]